MRKSKKVYLEVWPIKLEEDKCTETIIGPVVVYFVRKGSLYKPKKRYYDSHPFLKELYKSMRKAQPFLKTHYRFDIEKIELKD